MKRYCVLLSRVVHQTSTVVVEAETHKEAMQRAQEIDQAALVWVDGTVIQKAVPTSPRELH